ncbi:unnamed protein product, partial [Symbiodinium microadriaticum]
DGRVHIRPGAWQLRVSRMSASSRPAIGQVAGPTARECTTTSWTSVHIGMLETCISRPMSSRRP